MKVYIVTSIEKHTNNLFIEKVYSNLKNAKKYIESIVEKEDIDKAYEEFEGNIYSVMEWEVEE